MASSKVKATHRTANPIETATNPDGGFVQTAKKQFEGTGQDFIAQLLGMDYSEPDHSRKAGGIMNPGEAIDLRGRKTDNVQFMTSQRESGKQERKIEVLGGIDYHSEVIHGSERLTRREASELDKRIDDILVELKRLIGSSSILKMEFAEISVETKPVQAGKYYLNFFEWLLIEIKKIRMKVEDAGAWLAVMKSKKSQKKYGKMAKKFGTSFTLNNERTPATQTG